MRALLLSVLLAVGGVSASLAASGEHGMVASEHRLASEAGLAILRQGGNAVDAAVATSLAVGVVNPSSCGIGGGGFMLIFEQDSGHVSALDYRETAPADASRDMFVRDGRVRPELSQYGGLAVAVPGEIAGLLQALRRFGTLPFATVAAPALAYARDGFPVEEHLARAIANNQERIRQQPGLAAILLHPDGTPLRVGERLRQTDLARTLATVAEAGAPGFYSGPIAAAIVDTVRANGGVMQPSDLADYRPVWRRALRGRFDGFEIFSMPPPSSGGGVLLETLAIIANDDLRALQHNTPTYIHLMAEAMQFSFAARAALYGDPGYVRVPLSQLLAPAYGTRLRQRISAPTTFSPQYYGTVALDADHGTSHLSVVDAAGNAVACTTSINTSFGSMVVARDTGIILNNTMDDFSAQPGVPNVYGLIGSEANSIAPGKRPLSSMTPTIVTRDGHAVAVAGGSGGPFIISGTIEVLLNSLIFDMDADAAVAAPRLHHQWMPPALMLEPSIPALTRTALQRQGHRVIAAPEIGAVQLVRRKADGSWDGASDPRKGGVALGW